MSKLHSCIPPTPPLLILLLDSGQLYVNDINPSDIKQGELGTCYLLSAIAALCIRMPNLIKNSLMTSGKEWYGLRWYPDGKPSDTWVDDKFPTKDGKIRFASSEKNELWVAVMEKIYAKQHGTYLSIEGGLSGDALHELTGKPSVSHNLQTNWDGRNWDVVGACVDKSKVVCAGIHGSPLRRMILIFERYAILILTCIYDAVDSAFEACGLDCILNFFEFIFSWAVFGICLLAGLIDTFTCGLFSTIHVMLCVRFVGLVPGHAYSVLEVKSIPICGCLETKMVKLRNPWGKGEWNGWYSDNSSAWTFRPDLKKICGLESKEDGAFWMSMNDFQKYFDTVDILHSNPGFFETRMEGDLKKKSVSVDFKVPSQCKLRASFTQPRKDMDKRYICKIGIKQGGKFLTRTDYNPGSCNHSTDEVHLTPGTYQVVIDGRRNAKTALKARVMISASIPGINFENIGGTVAPVITSISNQRVEERAPVNVAAPKVVPNPSTPEAANSTSSTLETEKGHDNDDDDDDDDSDDDGKPGDAEKGQVKAQNQVSVGGKTKGKKKKKKGLF